MASILTIFLVVCSLVVQSYSYVFSVWAPHATSASVSPATQNNGRWSDASMTSSSNGTWSVSVSNVQVGDGYVFKFSSPSGSIVRLDPRAQSIANGTGNWKYSVVHDPNFDWGGASAFKFVSAEKVIVYEAHLPTFNVPQGSEMGTFYTAIEKLDYLQQLGITAIEFLPTSTFAGSAKGWGYNPDAPFATMEAFGGYKGLKTFVKEANLRGIGVILDIVWNHAGPNNIVKDYDGFKGTSGNGIYFFESADNAQTLWGPRWDYESPQVAQYILDSISMFIDEYHISGFRWDSTVCIRLGEKICWTSSDNIPSGWKLMQKGNTIVSKNGGFSVAEDNQGYDKITEPVSSGGAGFTSQWGYPFFYAFEPQLTMSDNSNVNMNLVSDSINDSSGDGGDPHRMLFTENHDMSSNQNKGRIPSIVNPGGNPYAPTYWAQKKATLGMGVILTAELHPMLFYGQEFLTYATFDYPIPPNIDWGLASANKGIVQEVTDLISLRLNKNGTTSGLLGFESNILMLSNDAKDKVVVLERTGTGLNSVIVVINMFQTQYSSFELKNLPKDGTWYVRFNGDNIKYSTQYKNFGVSQTSISVSGGSGSLMVPEYSIIVLSQ